MADRRIPELRRRWHMEAASIDPSIATQADLSSVKRPRRHGLAARLCIQLPSLSADLHYYVPRIRQVIALLLLVIWTPVVSHCLIEEAMGATGLGCCDSQEH